MQALFPAQDILGFFGTYLCWMLGQHFGAGKQEWWPLAFPAGGGDSMEKSSRESRVSCPLRGAGGTLAEQHVPASRRGVAEFPDSWHEVPRALQSQGKAAGAVRGFSGLWLWSLGFKREHPRLLYWQHSGAQWRGLSWDRTAENPSKTTSWEEFLLRKDLFFVFERTLITVAAKAHWNSLASGSSEAPFHSFQILS